MQKKEMVEYIEDALSKGYSLEYVKAFLIQHGYTKDQVVKSVKIVRGKGQSFFDRSLVLFSITFLFLFIFGLTAKTGSSFFLGIIGFFPTVVNFVAVIVLVEHYKNKNLAFVWLFPFVFSGFFFLLGETSNIPVLQQMNITELSVLNLVLSLTFTAILGFIGVFKREKLVVEFHKPDLREYIQSIEDKCKAINFVVGRVYRMSSGGTKGMRDKIKIDSEWYNQFSNIKEEDYKEKSQYAIGLLQRIRGQLFVSYGKEKDVFGSEHKHLKNLDRSSDGSDKVIDVLIKNDKDPVKTYFSSALNFCDKAIDGFKKL